jgi:hypothetical protein
VVDMTGRYNTELSPAEEQQFRDWASRQRAQAQRNPLADMYDYDIKGWWKEHGGQDLGAAGTHLTDQYKKPNHPTFSDESIYHGVDGHEGGHWGGQEGSWTWTPGKSNRQFHTDEETQDYFNRVEPDVKLLQGQPMPMGVPDV